jgi:MarR family transcriptional regulator, organic hydroperoxide resistance regulator
MHRGRALLSRAIIITTNPSTTGQRTMAPKEKKKTVRATPRRKAPLTVTRKELLVKGSDNQFRELVHSALSFSARLEAVRNSYGRLVGLSGIQYSILVSIAHLQDENDVGVTEIASHLSLSGTFVTTETKKLADRGLVEKRGHEADRRRVVLRLTDDGWDLLNGLSTLQREVNDVHFGPLSRADFVALHRMMRDLTLSTDKALVLLEQMSRLEGKTIGRIPHHVSEPNE